MKSRKSDQLTRRSTRSANGNRHRRKLRETLRTFETLEERRLLSVEPWSDGFYYPPIGLATGFMPPEAYERYAQISPQQYGGGSGGSGGGGDGEGGLGSTTVSELEVNDQFSQAQPINVGTGPDNYASVSIVGSLVETPARGFPIEDVDYFVLPNLRAGDVIDVRAESIVGAELDVSIYNASFNELIGDTSSFIASIAYPLESPLSTDGNTAFSYLIPEDGTYYARIAENVLSLPILNYDLRLRTFRPSLEAEPVGTVQTIFLDFDGEILQRSIFGLPGTARLSPLSSFLAGWGLQPEDESRVIDKIVETFVSKFYGPTAVSSTGGNGDYFLTGQAGDFALRVLNSRDHADPFGQENVSRVIIGGTQEEFGIPTVGVAQSVDPGNFANEETAVVLLDLIDDPTLWGGVPVSGDSSREDLYTTAIGGVAAHEVGHLVGGFHTDNLNDVNQLMDTGGITANITGEGPDGIFGTPDDVDIQFGTDVYDPFTAWQFGRQDSAAIVGFGLSTGTTGGSVINGLTFNDRNGNRRFDTGDRPLPQVRVYADENNNEVYDFGEFFVLSGDDGTYSMVVPPGNYQVRQEVPFGARQTTVPEAYGVSLATGQVVNGINFGSEFVDLGFNGVKYNDVNGNGFRDPGEEAIEGVWVYIDLDGDNRIDIGEPADQTDEEGRYFINFPGPGVYAVREVTPPGFIQTFPGVSDDGDPSNDYEHTVVLTGNPLEDAIASSGLDFGNRLTVDFGDAPQSYGTAAHGFVDELVLGALWDAEEGSLFSATATGDDNNNLDDEDGVVLARPLVAGSTNNRVSVTAVNATGAPAYLHGWVDYDRDGVFTSSEKVITNQPIETGTTSVTFAAPANAVLGDTIARFRYSSELNLTATGNASDGEVEDYLLTVVETLQIANDDQFSVARSSVLNELDVLDNDFSLPGETLTIVTTSGSQAGAAVQINAARDRVLYTPPAGFIGQDVFTYTVRNSGGDVDQATVVVDVDLFFDNPLAVDDSLDVPTNSVDIPINVLANDIEGQAGALTIISATQGDKNGSVAISTGGKSLRYTPARDFGGTEFFTYTVADSAGNQSTANVTVHTLPGARADDDVLIQMVATDLAGNPITAVEQGEEFLIQVVVDDLRFDSANPGVAAGVFSAYADLLYDRQLVSPSAPDPGSGFNFDVTFFNDYFNFQNGDASVPGIIDEFGAFNVRQVFNEPDPLVLAAITFTAGSPGIASFMPDPADAAPPNDTLLFDTPGAAVPDERIRFLGTSVEVLSDDVEFPVAVDDSVPGAIPEGSVGFSIDVLANDRPGSTGSIRIESVTDGAFGITAIDTQGTPDPSDDRVLYTPNGGFNGADQFTYTIQDTRGIQSTATVTVRVGDPDADDQVGLRLSVTDLNGSPIDSIAAGSQFQLRGFVQDLRGFGVDRGVFAAYEDVLYTSSVVSPVPSSTNDPDLGFQVEFGPNYQEVFSGDIRTPGLINEIGAVQAGQTPLGTTEQLLFIVTMTADAVGTANFIGDPADISPLHDTLTFEPPAPVSFDEIRYGFDSLTVVAGSGGGGSGGGSGESWYHNSGNQFDVNNDGYVSPIDALGVINTLNTGGSGELPSGGGEGEDDDRLYVDVNADGSLSPIDALLVINHLNSGGGGEGEADNSWELAAADVRSPNSSANGLSEDFPGSSNLSGFGEELPASRIEPRLTGAVFGPARHELFAGFGEDEDEESSQGTDELLDQIAYDIDQNWKSNFRS